MEKGSPRKLGAMEGEAKSVFKLSSILVTHIGVFWEITACGGEWRFQLQPTHHTSQNLEL